MRRSVILAAALAACTQPLPPLPPRTAESPLAPVAEIRTIAIGALADGRPVQALCDIVGPGYRVEVTTPAAVEIPLGPEGRPDATALRCRRGSAVARADGIPADATRMIAVFRRNGTAAFAR
jgi:hypothetical protein